MNTVGYKNMIILDIETTGIKVGVHGIASLGAVDSNNGQTFYGECQVPVYREIDPRALEVNGFTIEQLHDVKKQSEVGLYLDFIKWSEGRVPNVLGGHNVGHFDILFLEELHSRHKIEGKFPFSYRTLDLHSVAYAVFGESLSHAQICDKLGIPQEPKPHNALEGAKSEYRALNELIQLCMRLGRYNNAEKLDIYG